MLCALSISNCLYSLIFRVIVIEIVSSCSDIVYHRALIYNAVSSLIKLLIIFVVVRLRPLLDDGAKDRAGIASRLCARRGAWWRGLVQTVPPELAWCEFECRGAELYRRKV
jgi:hypothetical protein